VARESIVNTPHRGSFVLGDYELRVTQRCLAEDLHVGAQSPFEDIMNHEIVKALVKDRATVPAGGKTVGPEAGDMTLYRLGYGHDHRGVTWWDEAHRVVWLCAYHPAHRSGSEEDAFPFFDSLISDSRIMPTADDYERLFEERDEEFDDFVLSDAQEALAEARQTPGIEIQRLIGGRVGTGVVVEVVETLEEIFVAFKWEDVHEDELILIKMLAAFVPNSTWDQWRQARLPTRELDESAGETCFSYLKE
jgi:hypothetical protein